MAAISSVVETCKRLKINPREYLEEVLRGLGGRSDVSRRTDPGTIGAPEVRQGQ
jgi:hypothetical protein